jgi:hypothetical protein
LEKERMTTTHNLRLKQLPGKPWLITLATIMATATAAQAVSLGQTDDFEDLTTQNWGIGAAGAQPTVVPSGGPVDDGAFLTYNSDGSGNTGRMLIANSDQWSGDYLAAGVSAITFDVQNLNTAQTLNLRVALGTSTNSRSGDWFASTLSVDIAPTTDWTQITLPITAGDLTSVVGAGTASDVLSSVVAIRILSSAAPSARGDQIAASISVDNITATPEPASAILVASALLLIRRR